MRRIAKFSIIFFLMTLWLGTGGVSANEQAPFGGNQTFSPAPAEAMVLEGKIVVPQRACSFELAYDFLSKDGQLAEIWIGLDTITPSVDYWPNYLDEIRIFVRERQEPVWDSGIVPDPPPRGLPVFVVLRLEVIKNTYYETHGPERQVGLELAREMIFNGFNNNKEFIIDQIARMSDQQVREIKQIIYDDIAAQAGRVVGFLGRDYRALGWVYNVIDDRLGILKYDRVAVGHRDSESPTDYIVSADAVFDNFITSEGELIKNVLFDPSTLWPEGTGLITDDDELRVYIRTINKGDIIPVYHVVKVELLKKN